MSLMKIKDLFHYEKGSLQSTKATPGEYDFITAAADWKTHNEFTHNCEALIFAAAASGSLGRTHYVNGKFISSDLCFIITPKDPDKYPIDIKFYHLLFLAFKDEIVRNTKSGTSKEAIGLRVFGNYELPYFSIDKQVKTRELFVNAQESSDKIESELTHQLDLVKQLRQAFLREAMQGKLVPQDPNDEPASVLLEKIKAEKARLVKEKKIKKQKVLPPIKRGDILFKVPENWSWCRLGAIVTFENGDRSKAYPSGMDIREKGIPFINSKTLINGSVDFTHQHMQFINKEKYDSLRSGKAINNDILMVLRGATRGKTAVFRENSVYKTGFINAQLIIIRTITPEFLGYLMLLFKSPIFNLQIDNIESGSAQPHFSGKNLELLNVPLPPLSEQQRIVAKLDELMKFCDDLESSIKDSQQKNELLLKQVLAEALGVEIKEEPQQKTSKGKQKVSKFDPNTTLMEIVELLKKHGKLHAKELWKMSKYPDDIDAFYAELKKQIEVNKVVKESNEKGYLELA